MDRDLLARNVSQDSSVGGRRTPDIVLGLQSVNRHDDLQIGQRRPRRRKRPEGARDDLDVNASIEQQRNHQLELAIADQRVTPDDRQMQGLEAVDDLENAVDQFLSFAIAKTSQSDSAA